MIDMTESEKEFYQALYNRSKIVVRGYDNDHSVTMGNKYAALFALLMRMRQACDHPFLVLAKIIERDKTAKNQQQLDRNNGSGHILGFRTVKNEKNDSDSKSVEGKSRGKGDNGADCEEDEEGESDDGLLGDDFLKQLYNKLIASNATTASSALSLQPTSNTITINKATTGTAAEESSVRAPVSLSYIQSIMSTLKSIQQTTTASPIGPDTSLAQAHTLTLAPDSTIECSICLEVPLVSPLYYSLHINISISDDKLHMCMYCLDCQCEYHTMRPCILYTLCLRVCQGKH